MYGNFYGQEDIWRLAIISAPVRKTRRLLKIVCKSSHGLRSLEITTFDRNSGTVNGAGVGVAAGRIPAVVLFCPCMLPVEGSSDLFASLLIQPHRRGRSEATGLHALSCWSQMLHNAASSIPCIKTLRVQICKDRLDCVPRGQLQFSMQKHHVLLTGVLSAFVETETPLRCGFEGVRERSRASRISNLEIRCRVPARTVGLSRVYLTARDARGLPSMMSANVGMMQLEYVEPRLLLSMVQTTRLQHMKKQQDCCMQKGPRAAKEPVHLFDVEPKQIIDGTSSQLEVHGSNFRPVTSLRCGFESRVQRRSLLTHRVPVWTWLGHVQCSSRIAQNAIRTFVMRLGLK